MSPGAHAVLSASSAHRWLLCPPSAQLEQQFPDEGSAYAAEGTLAHALAELKARKYFIAPMGPKKYAAELKKLQQDAHWADEMDGHTDAYMDELKRIALSYDAAPYVAIEQRVDFSPWVPDGFGTADCIIIGGDELNVVDFKYGKGVPVDAENNPQMRLYAVGAVLRYIMLYDIQKVRMTIVQPRLGHVSSEELPKNDLMRWAETVVKPAAAQAAKGEDGFFAGEHCRFCRARHQCRARAAQYFELEPAKDPALMDAEEIGRILDRAQGLKSWVSDLEEYALAKSLEGVQVPGWKAVEGRSNRTFTDQDAAFAALIKAGVAEAMLYERKPVTLTAAEKVAGKAAFAEICGPYVVKPPGKPTLVPDTDKRPAITDKVTAAEAFSADDNKQND